MFLFPLQALGQGGGFGTSFIASLFDSTFNPTTGIQGLAGSYTAGPLAPQAGNIENFIVSTFSIEIFPIEASLSNSGII